MKVGREELLSKRKVVLLRESPEEHKPNIVPGFGESRPGISEADDKSEQMLLLRLSGLLRFGSFLAFHGALFAFDLFLDFFLFHLFSGSGDKSYDVVGSG